MTRSAASNGDPTVFAIAEGQSGFPPATSPVNAPVTASSGPVLQIRSVTTGALSEDHLATDVGDISFSPDRSAVYYESTSGRLDPFPIDRVPVAGGRPVPVASGEDPAISPDGASLAYATGSGEAIAVDDLARDTTRLIDLTALIGPDASFNNTPGVVAWLSPSELVAIPPGDVSGFSSPTSTSMAAGPPGTCTALYLHNQQCAIVVQLSAAQPAHVVTLALPRDFAISAAGGGPTPGTLLLGSFGSAARFAITATTTARQAVVAVPDDGLVEAFSPTDVTPSTSATTAPSNSGPAPSPRQVWPQPPSFSPTSTSALPRGSSPSGRPDEPEPGGSGSMNRIRRHVAQVLVEPSERL